MTTDNSKIPDIQAESGNTKGRNTRFQKGQSGNPAGRPKNATVLTDALRKHLIEHPEDVKAITKAVVKKLKKGDIPAIKEVLERLEGKVPQPVQTKLDGHITLEVVEVDE